MGNVLPWVTLLPSRRDMQTFLWSGEGYFHTCSKICPRLVKVTPPHAQVSRHHLWLTYVAGATKEIVSAATRRNTREGFLPSTSFYFSARQKKRKKMQPLTCTFDLKNTKKLSHCYRTIYVSSLLSGFHSGFQLTAPLCSLFKVEFHLRPSAVERCSSSHPPCHCRFSPLWCK